MHSKLRTLPIEDVIFPVHQGEKFSAFRQPYHQPLTFKTLGPLPLHLPPELAAAIRISPAEEPSADLRLSEMELRWFRSQLDAHFIFSALNTIVGQAEQESRQLVSVIEGLSGYLQFSLAAADRALVPFGEELEAVVGYLDVQKARFDEAIAVRVVADAACRGVLLPGIFLHPLVENAIKHGRKTLQATLHLTIEASYRATSRRFLLRVINSGRWIDPASAGNFPHNSARSGGLGNDLVRRSLELLYPGRHGFTIGPGDFVPNSATAEASGEEVIAELFILDPELTESVLTISAGRAGDSAVSVAFDPNLTPDPTAG